VKGKGNGGATAMRLNSTIACGATIDVRLVWKE
jgi:hypothetical protein